MEESEKIAMIGKYLQGELQEEERGRFEKMIQEDPEFAEEVNLAITLDARFKVEKKQHWQSLLAKGEASDPVPEVDNQAKIRRLRWVRSVAAILLVALLASLLFLYLNPSSDIDVLANRQLTNPYPDPVVLMGPEEVTQDQNLYIRAYSEKEYEQGIAPLERLIEKNQEDPELYFYLALCQLYQSKPDYEKAISNFEESRRLKEAIYGPRADWFISLAYIKSGQLDQAKVLLQKIVDVKAWKSAEARVLLNKME